MGISASQEPRGGDLTRRQWRMIVLAALGGGLEYYDFIVYGIFAQAIAAAFFPAGDPLALTLALAIFSIGYLARPIGGMISSHYGDRYGRKTVFVVTVFTMSACTLAIGLIPTYATWGLAATFLLVLLRFIQGLCIGGELPGAITFVVETAEKRPGLACGIVFALVNGGVLLAAFVNLALGAWLSPAAMLDHGWRIAFVIGGLLGLLSFWLRRNLEETPEFLRIRHDAARQPVREVLRTHPGSILLGCAVVALTAGFNGLLFAHMPAYLGQVLGYDRQAVAIAMNVALLAMSLSLLAASWWADRVPPRFLLLGSSVLLLVGAPVAYQLLAGGGANLMLVLSLLAIAVAGANGSFAYLIAGLFPARVRFSGVALSLNISFTLLSGLGPLAANALIQASGRPAAPGLIVSAVALIGLVASLFLGRRQEVGAPNAG
ncbi:MFS transporter [Sphingosinicella sp. BN140058]|uniref:MFS transporter n=1 Tax=Sphingosinicella sp. BN140058 TaxID=1892855 RepID=UPI001982309D|nr:MFS transporter [Sphingosinicella sp. BN140058]